MPTGFGAAAGAGACMTGSSTGDSAISPRAPWRRAWAAGSSGWANTSGIPESDCSRTGIVSGAVAAGRDEAVHVLDHAGDLQLELGRHLRRPGGDLLGHRLGRGHEQEFGLG